MFNSVFVAKLVILGILLSTVVILFSISVTLLLKVLIGKNAVILDFVARSLISGILSSTVVILPFIPVILLLKVLFNNNQVVSILSTFVFKVLKSVFLVTSFFTTLLNLVKSSETLFNLSVSILSISVFNLAKFVFDGKVLISTCFIFLKSVFLHNYLDLV